MSSPPKPIMQIHLFQQHAGIAEKGILVLYSLDVPRYQYAVTLLSSFFPHHCKISEPFFPLRQTLSSFAALPHCTYPYFTSLHSPEISKQQPADLYLRYKNSLRARPIDAVRVLIIQLLACILEHNNYSYVPRGLYLVTPQSCPIHDNT